MSDGEDYDETEFEESVDPTSGTHRSGVEAEAEAEAEAEEEKPSEQENTGMDMGGDDGDDPYGGDEFEESKDSNQDQEPRPPSGSRSKDPSPRATAHIHADSQESEGEGALKEGTADIDLTALAGPTNNDIVAKLHEENKVLREQLKNFNEALNSKLAPGAGGAGGAPKRPVVKKNVSPERSSAVLSTKAIQEKAAKSVDEMRNKALKTAQKQTEYYRKINQDLQRHIDNSVHATRMIEFENRIVEQDRIIKKLQAENKTLHLEKIQSDKALMAEVGLNEEYPKKLRMVTEDNRVLKDKLRKYVEKAAITEKTSKQHRDQVLKLSDRCKKLAEILKAKGLDGFIGFDEKKAKEELAKRDEKIAQLEKDMNVLKKANASDRRKFKREAQEAGEIIVRLQQQVAEAKAGLDEKEKELKLVQLKQKSRAARSPQPDQVNSAPIPHPDIPAKPSSPSTHRTNTVQETPSASVVAKEESLPKIAASEPPPQPDETNVSMNIMLGLNPDGSITNDGPKIVPRSAPAEATAADEKSGGDFDDGGDDTARSSGQQQHPELEGAQEFVSEGMTQNVDLRHPVAAEGGGASANVIATPSQPASEAASTAPPSEQGDGDYTPDFISNASESAGGAGSSVGAARNTKPSFMIKKKKKAYDED